MSKRPVFRLALLALAVLLGLGLFLALGPKAPVVVHPAGVDANP